MILCLPETREIEYDETLGVFMIAYTLWNGKVYVQNL
jgi:hypothetical protein